MRSIRGILGVRLTGEHPPFSLFVPKNFCARRVSAVQLCSYRSAASQIPASFAQVAMTAPPCVIEKSPCVQNSVSGAM
jgi:hypothetical protein